MKLFITFLFFFFWGSLSSVNAQQLNRGEMSAIQNLIIQHGDQLNLTDEQKTELIALQLDRREQFRGTRVERQRGDMRSQRRSSARQQTARGERSQRTFDTYSAIDVILTEDQITELKSIRLDHAEKQHELRTIRNQIFVENASLDEIKAEEVLVRLNQISEIQKTLQSHRIENPGERNIDFIRENMTEIRTIQNDLKNLVTVAEYEQLRPVMMMGPQMQRVDRTPRRAVIRRW